MRAPHFNSCRDIDDLVYLIKSKLPECSISGLEMVYNALPGIGSGYRLNETVTEAATRYNEAVAAAAGVEQAAGAEQAAEVEQAAPA